MTPKDVESGRRDAARELLLAVEVISAGSTRHDRVRKRTTYQEERVGKTSTTRGLPASLAPHPRFDIQSRERSPNLRHLGLQLRIRVLPQLDELRVVRHRLLSIAPRLVQLAEPLVGAGEILRIAARLGGSPGRRRQ